MEDKISDLKPINTFEELAKIAYKGEELSDLAPLETKYIYLRLYDLYSCYRNGKLSKEKCIEIKNKLRIEYSNIIKEHERNTEFYRTYVKNKHDNAGLIIRLEKTTDKDELLDISLQILQNCLNDKSLYERNKKKIYKDI